MKKKLSPNDFAKRWDKALREAWPTYQKGMKKMLKVKSPWMQFVKTKEK